MKDINTMSLEDMKKEIREHIGTFANNKCNTEPFMFVSYSHRDADRVYPVVLEWIRSGYNVYMDLDFEVHSSSENWVDMMKIQLSKVQCTLFVAFASLHYRLSYPALMELMLTRSERIDRLRQGCPLMIDIIEMDDSQNITELRDLPQEDQDSVIKGFENLNAKLGVEFGKKNQAELQTLTEGFKTLKDENVDYIEIMKDSYSIGVANFYRFLLECQRKWRDVNNLNGNLHSLDSKFQERFNNLRLNNTARYRQLHLEGRKQVSLDHVSESERKVPHAESDTTVVTSPEPMRRMSCLQSITMREENTPGCQVTIGQVQKMFENIELVRNFRAVRNGLPRGRKGPMDYAMASVLAGCNQITDKSPAFQLNYYNYAVATKEPAPGDKIGATWTWSSNCRKFLGLKGSGQIPKEFNDTFSSLPLDTTLNKMQELFQEGIGAYSTPKNESVIAALEILMNFANSR